MGPRDFWGRDRDEHRDRDWRERRADREDYGQADYSTEYGYDSRHRVGYRTPVQGREQDYTADPGLGARDRDDRIYADPQDRYYEPGRDERPHEGRSWKERASSFLGMRDEDRRDYETRDRQDLDRDGRDDRIEREERRDRRDYDNADRVIWAAVMGRLEHERGIDMRDIRISVQDREVTIDGSVRTRDDKRRVEDLAEVRGVTHVQNNLRVRNRSGGWRGGFF